MQNFVRPTRRARRWVLLASLSLMVSLGGVATAPIAGAAVSCPTVDAGHVVPFPAPGTSVDCTGASLVGADLRGADLTGWTFQNADLTGADLTDATLLGANLASTDLSTATLVRTDLTYSYVVGTVLHGADLTGATLRAAQISNVDLSGAALAGAHLAGLVTGSATIDGATTLPTGWLLRQGRLLGPGVSLSGRVVVTADLSDVDLTGANLSGAVLENATVTGAALAGADLRGTYLAGADLTGAAGLATTLTNSVTVWLGATCPDAKPSEAHDGQSCTRALDLVAPTAALGTAPLFTRSNAFFVASAFRDSGSGIRSWRMRHRTMVSGGSTWSAQTTDPWSGDNPASVAAFVAPGHRTCLQVQAQDNAGHLSPWSTERCSDAVYDSSGNPFFPDTRWSFVGSKDYFEWSLESTKTHGAVISDEHPLYVRQVGVIATTCPTCGWVSIYVGSTKVGSVYLARSTTTPRAQLLVPRLATRRYGVVRVVVESPTGRPVRIDAVAVTGA